METLRTVLLGLLFFGALILIHECGHYFFARLFGVQVNEFSVGFGPKLLRKRSNKTGIAYTLRAFPVGGYVMMEGENSGEAALPADAVHNGEPFFRKPIWQRMVITVAGATMNLLLGAILLILLAVLTPTYGSTTVAMIPEESVLADTAMLPGDRIVEIDGNTVQNSNELVYEIAMTMGREVSLDYIRDGVRNRIRLRFATEESDGHLLGVTDFFVLRQEKTVGAVLKMAYSQMRMSVKMVFDSLWGLVRGEFGLRDLSGPVGVTKAIGDAAKSDAEAAKSGVQSYALLEFCAIISVNLGIMNLLPLPALDGGRLLLLLAEGIFRRRLPEKAETAINLAGLAALLLLSVLIAGKDIIGLI